MSQGIFITGTDMGKTYVPGLIVKRFFALFACKFYNPYYN